MSVPTHLPRTSDGDAPRVAVIGAGLLGLAAAYRLAQGGVSVTVYERDAQLGGLAGTTPLDGIPIDRFYHVTLPTDERVIEMADELGLADRFRFRRSGVGFYHQGKLASMSTPRELLSFPGLTAVDRMRLVAFIARCQVGSSYEQLEETPDRGLARAHLRAAHLGGALAAAARLQVRRPLRRHSRHLPLVALAPDGEVARQVLAGGHGHARRRLPDARRRARPGHRGPRRKRAPQHHRQGDRVELRPRRGHPEHARLRAARPGDLHPPAHGHGPAARPRPGRRGGPGPLPLPRHRVPRDAPARAASAPGTRSTSRTGACRSPRWSRPPR